eukprot:Skav228344  [mRNA]  locus=scaffold1898:179506:184119:+ [translate_table: standard]
MAIVVEPLLIDAGPGQHVSVVAHVVARYPHHTVYRTHLKNQFFWSKVTVSAADSHCFLAFEVHRAEGVTWLQPTTESRVIDHQALDFNTKWTAVETCSGLGFGGHGLLANGIQTAVYNDQNRQFCNELSRLTTTPVVCGDVSEASTIFEVSKHSQGAQFITSGFSCQPFSVLGDQRGQHDPRAQSLPGSLMMGYFLNKGVMVLECTKEANDSSWVQDVLRDFSQQTGYHVEQKVLDLHWILPTRRTRWWAVLTHPSMPFACIPSLPSLPFIPAVIHMFGRMMPMTPEMMDQLILDDEELMWFNQHPKGIAHHILDTLKVAPTATHSWGNQIHGCQCGCRPLGFHPLRLQERGLYGTLVATDRTYMHQGKELTVVRHPHAMEVASLNGVSPITLQHDEPTNCRLQLAAIGQLASPIQLGWVTAIALHAVAEFTGVKPINPPQTVLWHLMEAVFHGVDQVWNQPPTKYMMIYRNQLAKLLINRELPPVEESDDDQEKPSESAALSEPTMPAPAETPTRPAPEAPEPRTPYSGNGGIACFSTGPEEPPTAEVNQSAELISPTIPWTCPAVEGDAALPPTTAAEAGVPEPPETNTPMQTESPVPEADASMHATTGEDTPAELNPADSCAPEESLEDIDFTPPQDMPSDQICVHVGHHGQEMRIVIVTRGTTVGQLLVAEQAMHMLPTMRVHDPMGRPMSIAAELVHGQRILLTTEQEHQATENPSFCTIDDRIDQLWHQRGFVGSDEMTFYLRHIARGTETEIQAPLIAHDKHDLGLLLEDWIMSRYEHMHQTSASAHQCFTVCLFKQHWYPLALQITGQQATVQSSPEGIRLLQEQVDMCQLHDVTMRVHPFGKRYDHDCGFQALAWLEGVIHGDTKVRTFQQETIINMRSAFELHLRAQPTQRMVRVFYGGTNDAELLEELRNLLEQHAVAAHRSEQLAKHLLTEMGSTVIAQTLKSSKSWKDLKTRASQCRPPIQLVLHSELQQTIADRMTQGKSWGRKSNKAKPQPKPQVQITPDQIQIPTGIFQQEDGTPMTQITIHQVSAHARGIAVVAVDQAKPFLELTQPLGPEGLAMIILGQPGHETPGHLQSIAFPAQCCATDEPVLLQGALLQLGKQTVTRVLPNQVASIKEIPTRAYRLLAYRDQLTTNWDDFVSRPVKTILQTDGFDQCDKDFFLDLWDRQWMDINFRRAQQKDAVVFAVTVRIRAEHETIMEAINSQHGIYCEPRVDNGRGPSTGYRVVWLPKKSFAETQIAKTVTPQKCAVVRNGARYGLRVATGDAPAVHAKHRPDIQYLDGVKTTYRVGPLPWGTTKKAFQAALTDLGWQAIAGQPLGQVSNHEGCFWSATSTQHPSHWVFNMAHGDVLIAVKEAKDTSQPPPANTIIASDKTMKALQKPSGADKSADPWQEQDPWKGYQPTQTKAGPSTAQLAAIEATVTQKVLSSIKSEDATMEEPDPRFQQLEEQVKSLSENIQQITSTIATQHQQQQQQNAHVQKQIGGLKHQLDAQGIATQKAIDEKFEDQMERIDALLSKRLKQSSPN